MHPCLTVHSTRGVFPASQKQAIVFPRLKKPTLDPTILSSYRPISNLSSISKLIERVAAVRLVGHSEGNSLFPVHQSSYRHGHSTETAVLCVHNYIVSVLDIKRIVGLVLLDLSAAFDTVDQDTLLSVLHRRFGVCDHALSWVRSYLSDRTQNFRVNGVRSGPVAINCSVPQSSVLGPIMFISYTEDVSTLFNRHQSDIIYTPTTNRQTCWGRQSCQSRAPGLYTCIMLRTGARPEDSSWMLVSLRLKVFSEETNWEWRNIGTWLWLHPSCQCCTRPRCNVWLWTVNEAACHKGCEQLFLPSSPIETDQKTIVGQEVTAQLVSAFILSRLDYCNAVLSGLPRAILDPLQRVQKAAVRLVLNLRLRDHVTPALKQLHWLPVAGRIKLKLCLLMHLIHTGRAPQYLVNTIQSVITSSRRHLRSSEITDYVKRTTRTKFGERGFSHSQWRRVRSAEVVRAACLPPP